MLACRARRALAPSSQDVGAAPPYGRSSGLPINRRGRRIVDDEFMKIWVFLVAFVKGDQKGAARNCLPRLQGFSSPWSMSSGYLSSKRSRFMTLVQADTNSCRKRSCVSSLA